MDNKLRTLSLINHKKLGKILFETSPDMLAILDCDGRVLDCNKHFEDSTYYKKNELIGLVGPADLVFDDDMEKAHDAFEELKTKNIILNIALKIKRKDNSIFSTIWSGSTLLNASQKLEGYLVTGKDLSDIEELENRIITSKNQFHQEKMAIIGELSGRIAHDLRNPLSIIRISFENLKLVYGVDDSKQKLYDKIERSIDRIVHQTEEVLDFVREKPLTFTKTIFSDIMSEFLDSMKIPKNIRLILPKKNIVIYCDKRQFSTVLKNIILNGIQSINGKGLIAISLEKKDDEIILEVEDSGKGIAAKNLSRVFDPLYTTKQTGTGLGLACVKSIIKAHGGTISVTSPPTIFKITLPKNGPNLN